MKQLSPYLISGILVLAGCKAYAQNVVQPNGIPSAEDVSIEKLLVCKQPGGFPFKGRMMKDMNFTDQQLKAAVDIKFKASKKSMPIMADLLDLRHKLGNVMAESPIDKKQAKLIHDQISSRMSELGNVHFEAMLEMADQLTDEQRTKLDRKRLLMELFSGPPSMGPGPQFGPGMPPPPPGFGMPGPLHQGPPHGPGKSMFQMDEGPFAS